MQNTLIKIFKVLYNTYGPQGWWPADSPFEIIVGAILAQNTAWKNVEKAIKNLKDVNCLTFNSIIRMPTSNLAKLIRPSGFYNLKTKRLMELLYFIRNTYSNNLNVLLKEQPHILRARLLKIRGLGEETVDSILLYAANRPFFVIDAYTKRILQRHALIKFNATYSQIQKLMHQSLPRDAKLYKEYHALIVQLGKDYCKKNPQCGNCPLKSRVLSPES